TDHRQPVLGQCAAGEVLLQQHRLLEVVPGRRVGARDRRGIRCGRRWPCGGGQARGGQSGAQRASDHPSGGASDLLGTHLCSPSLLRGPERVHRLVRGWVEVVAPSLTGRLDLFQAWRHPPRCSARPVPPASAGPTRPARTPRASWHSRWRSSSPGGWDQEPCTLVYSWVHLSTTSARFSVSHSMSRSTQVTSSWAGRNSSVYSALVVIRTVPLASAKAICPS